MHTIVRLSDGNCKVMFVQKNQWTNVAFGLSAVRAALLCNILNGGNGNVIDLPKKLEDKLTVVPVNEP